MGKRTKMLEDYINNYNKNGDEIETDDFLNSINNSWIFVICGKFIF